MKGKSAKDPPNKYGGPVSEGLFGEPQTTNVKEKLGSEVASTENVGSQQGAME
jgi:hypothetical protein